VNTTILIPTYNRPRELRRHLRFLAGMNNPYPVLVLDGSSQSNASLNARIVAEHGFATIRNYPSELHQGLRYADGLRKVDTKYVVICADDDFVFPDAIEECAGFMEAHADYSAAIGRVKALLYSRRMPNIRRGFMLLDPLRNEFNLSHKWFVQRMLYLGAYTFTGCPPLFYSLRRTDQAARAFELVTAQMKYSSQEHLTNAVTLIFGKAATLPVLFGIRDYSSPAIVEPQRDDPDTYFTESDLNYIKSVIVPLLMENEKLTLEMAEFTADLFLKYYYPEDKRLPGAPAVLSGDLLMWLYRFAQAVTSVCLPRFFARAVGLSNKAMNSLRAAQREFIKKAID
jgi:glycosyltransferase domain-containing protein